MKEKSRKKARPAARANSAARRIGRMRLLACGTVILFLLLGARLFQLQILQGEIYAQRARSQQTRKVALESRRGFILDRSGQELAVDLPQFYTLGVYPAQLTNKRRLCQELASFTGRPVSHYLNRLQSPSKYIYLEWRLTPPQADRLQALRIRGINLRKTSGRFYPYYRSTSQLLGYTDVDGRGIAGLEVHCDEALHGHKGWETHQRSGRGVSFWDPLRSCAIPRDGGTVRLAIDIVAQDVLHHELQEAQTTYKAQWAGGVLLNPGTGEILAICSVPDFDPLRPEAGSQSHHKLRPVTDLIEPGSVFKVVGAAAALDRGVFSAGDSIYCEEGSYRLANWVLRDVHPEGWLSFEDVLVYSSNIGLAKISEMIGSEELYRYALRFGFGCPTGAEFPGEASGTVHSHNEWRSIDRANIAMGQGLSATMLQVAMAFSAIANDGRLMRPYVVQEIRRGDESEVTQPVMVREVITPETANTLTEMMKGVVDGITAIYAISVPGYRVAGKTGTASISVPGGYKPDSYIASFAGFVPSDDPVLAMLVKIDEPKDVPWGSAVCAPVFARLASAILPYLKVAPDAPALVQGNPSE